MLSFSVTLSFSGISSFLRRKISKKLCWSTDPLPDVVTCFKQGSSPHAFIEDWLKRGILLKLPIPAWFSSVRCFLCLKEDWEIRLSFFNRSVNPSFTETLQKILDLFFSFYFIFQVLWVTRLDVTDASVLEVFHSSLEASESS